MSVHFHKHVQSDLISGKTDTQMAIQSLQQSAKHWHSPAVHNTRHTCGPLKARIWPLHPIQNVLILAQKWLTI